MTPSGALLVIDVQGDRIRDNTSHIVSQIRNLVHAYKPEDVFYLQYKNKLDSFYIRFLNWSGGMTDTETQIIDTVFRNGSLVFSHYGYLLPQDIISHLQSYQTVGVCGFDTDACVLGAMYSLWENNIHPILFEKYCFSCGGKELHENAVRIMERQFGTCNIRRETIF